MDNLPSPIPESLSSCRVFRVPVNAGISAATRMASGGPWTWPLVTNCRAWQPISQNRTDDSLPHSSRCGATSLLRRSLPRHLHHHTCAICSRQCRQGQLLFGTSSLHPHPPLQPLSQSPSPPNTHFSPTLGFPFPPSP